MKQITKGLMAFTIAGILTTGVFLLDNQKVDIKGADLEIGEVEEVYTPPIKTTDKVDFGKEAPITKKEATTTGVTVNFTYLKQESSVSINYDGYNSCRNGVWGTSTVVYCKGFLRQQLNDNAKWAKEGIDAQVKTDYSDEVTTDDL